MAKTTQAGLGTLRPGQCWVNARRPDDRVYILGVFTSPDGTVAATTDGFGRVYMESAVPLIARLDGNGYSPAGSANGDLSE